MTWRAISACPWFWAAFCEADLEQETVEVLREFCPKLIPMLLTNMAYQDDDEEVIAAEDDEVNVGRADRDQAGGLLKTILSTDVESTKKRSRAACDIES